MFVADTVKSLHLAVDGPEANALENELALSVLPLRESHTQAHVQHLVAKVSMELVETQAQSLIVGNIGHFDNEINLARLGAWKARKSTTSSLRRSFRLLRWSQFTKRCQKVAKLHFLTLFSRRAGVRDDSGMSHFMRAQLG